MTTAPTKNAAAAQRRIDEVEHGFDQECSDELSMELDILLADAGRCAGATGPNPRQEAGRPRRSRGRRRLPLRSRHRLGHRVVLGPRLRADRQMTRFTAALEPRITHRKDSRS